MIARAIAAEVPFAWVLGDEVYGSDRRLRIDLEQQERPFVLAIRSNEKLWSTLDDRMGQHAAAALAAAVPEEAGSASRRVPVPKASGSTIGRGCA